MIMDIVYLRAYLAS